jgi:hypothetical protein
MHCHGSVKEDPVRKLSGFAIATIATIVGIWLAAPAGAAPASLHVMPSSVAAGSSVQVSGTCEANTVGFAISHAFLHDATHDFAGVGAVQFKTNAAGAFSATAQVPSSIAPGSYDVTGRCGGGNLGISVTLTVTAASGPPTAVPAGSGGLAAPSHARPPWVLAGIGAALLLVGGVGLARRRATR